MCSILVIYDEKGILGVLREVLTRFDLVITEMRLPGLDGEGVVKHSRNSNNHTIPIIGISGTPWFLQNNCFDIILPKPFRLKELIDSVTQLMTISSKSAELLAVTCHNPVRPGLVSNRWRCQGSYSSTS